MGYCQCGCGAKTRLAPRTNTIHGWVKGQPLRYVKGSHARRKSPHEYLVDDETGCWVWQRAKDQLGYGHLRLRDNKTRRAHRHYYEQHVGPIPEGLELDHLCRNPSCVNPDHLEAVTHRENMLRGKGFAAENARKTHCPRGHAYDKENTHVDESGGRFCLACRKIRNDAAQLKRKAAKPLIANGHHG